MDDQTSIFLSAGYGLAEDLTVGMHIPYVIRRGVREGHAEGGTPEVHDHGNSEGIGDLSLVGQFRLLRMESVGIEWNPCSRNRSIAGSRKPQASQPRLLRLCP